MPATHIFETLRQRIMQNNAMRPLEQRALFWFTSYRAELTEWQKTQRQQSFATLALSPNLAKQIVEVSSASPGYLYFYLYDPKLRTSLPYYDRFPLTLVLSRTRQGFIGLNFHYLDYQHRAMLFDTLYEYRDDITQSALIHKNLRMRIKITYDVLASSKRYKYFRACIKQYLFSHIQTPLMKVGASEWPTALFLPVEMFAKATKRTVWNASIQRVE